MAKGIKDKVVILGMGCSKFGERWDKEADNLMVEAYTEAIADAGIDTKQIDAAWLSTAIEEQHVGKSATPLAVALAAALHPGDARGELLRQRHRGVPRRGLCGGLGRRRHRARHGRGEAQGHRLRRLPQRGRGPLNDMVNPNASAPGSFAQLAAAYRAKHKVDPKDLKGAMAHISVKSHDNGSRNPKAHLRNKITIDTVLNAPTVAEPLGLYDCCGVSDGAACAIVTTPDIAKGPRQEGHGVGEGAAGRRVERARGPAQLVGRQLLRHHPRRLQARVPGSRHRESRAISSSMFEVHDCFSVTELVTMEDLHISPEGGAIKDVLDGFYDCRRQDPLPDRRRLEVLRPSDRRLGLAHDLRDVPADARPRRRAPAEPGADLRPRPTTSAASRSATSAPSPSSASTERDVIPAKAGIHATQGVCSQELRGCPPARA
jgi:acetyl-CoA C-acetyltransferase